MPTKETEATDLRARLKASLGMEDEPRCANPYCENGRVRCEGGIAKGVYYVICRVCGTEKCEATHA